MEKRFWLVGGMPASRLIRNNSFRYRCEVLRSVGTRENDRREFSRALTDAPVGI